jgi:beta-phosphoglucomutase family hydrolase
MFVASPSYNSAPNVRRRAPVPGDLQPDLNFYGANGGGGQPPREFDAAIFDLDGVITQTAAVHSLAWKRMFDGFLRTAGRAGPGREFTHAHDYLTYVDGRPRYQGVESFLKSRGIELPFGTPDDSPDRETICGLGNRKNVYFLHIIESEGIAVYDSTIALIHNLRAHGIRIGLATSSRNSAVVLNRTGTAQLFATVVDGLVLERLGLKGKPEPDIFTTAARNLGVDCGRAIVIEDAVSGVQAGARGGFGLVIGVARENNEAELRENGADLVVRDLADTRLDEIARLVRARRNGPQKPIP